MSVLTKARSGLARSGATRSGYPIDQGSVLPKYALSGVARSGATRSNYHSTQVFVSIAGVQYATARPVAAQEILADTNPLTIQDILNDTPNTATMTAKGFLPTEGQAVIITLGSINNLTREFGGQILNLTHRYVGSPANYERDLNLIDYTWGLNKRKVRAQYANATVSAIVTDLIATYASGYTTQIAADAGAVVISTISFSDVDLTAALTQLMKQAGASWKCDYYPIVQVFFSDTSVTAPRQLNTINPFLTAFSYTRDLSQLLTRVRSEGGGGNLLADIAVGETIIPLDTAGWYPAAGIVTGPIYTVTTGWVNIGARRVSYTGILLGGGGGLVGPGAAPTGVLALALAGGAGIDNGSHNYAVTFVTASGESLPSPISTITVASVASPASAPTTATATIGTGPDPGTHTYAVTFVTGTGETTASPTVAQATGLTAAPASAPIAAGPVTGTGIDAGNNDYAVTFVTSIGETTAGPISDQITTIAAISDPSTEPGHSGTSGSGTADNPTGFGAGTYKWAYTFIRASDGAESALSSVSVGHIPGVGSTYLAFVTSVLSSPPAGYSRQWYRTKSDGSTYYRVPIGPTLVAALGLVSGEEQAGNFRDGAADSALGAAAPGSNGTALQQITLSSIPTGDANVTSRKLYRRSGGAGLKLLATIADNATTTYTDSTANASLGAAPPASSTAYLQRIQLSAIPTGPALVTSRKLYRTVAGGSQLKLLATLADNTTTAFLDTVTDAGLGANVPVSNTATANQVSVSSIPIGAATVTSRKLYRTAAGATQLKALATIADNTTSTYTDSTADSGLGANVPVVDGSGLAQPSGQVLAGATTLVVAGTGGFSSGGGWAVIGNGQQVIRYTGLTASSLTGIPASGPGSITASIAYNSTVTAAPELTGVPSSGVGSVAYASTKGTPVNLSVIVDAPAAQTALAALIGGDGIQEDALSDNRLGFTEATAQGEAWLALRDVVAVTLQFTTRDFTMRSGTMIAVNAGPPTNIVGSFLIQQVTQTAFFPKFAPTYTVVASSVAFTFEDFLRLINGAI